MSDTMQSLDQLSQLKTAAPEAPKYVKKVDKYGRAYATGKRKDAVARVWIKPGAGKVTVNGLTRTNPKFVQRHLGITPGQTYSPQALEAMRDELRTLDIFNSVKVTPATTLAPDGSLPINVDVTERKPRFFGIIQDQTAAFRGCDVFIGLKTERNEVAEGSDAFAFPA